MGEPGEIRAPGAISERPTTPEKGARMTRSSLRACAAFSEARAVSSAARNCSAVA